MKRDVQRETIEVKETEHRNRQANGMEHGRMGKTQQNLYIRPIERKNMKI